jgi:hypothetical protein
MPSNSGPIRPSAPLVFSFDTGDSRNSYLGEPTTNAIPNPSVNSLPTYGNGWSTYNTNQYCGNNGCGVFWDIPAIDRVENNIITTVSSHQIRSFDVIRPESTGGGVTANVDYVAKRISDTQFSLHAYDGSQDGSRGYINPETNGFKVHDSYWLDQRVSVNGSSFPTRWWGAPHLPNSALVKEIIPGGFDIVGGTATNCIRFHWFRSDATDGMAYGVDPYVTIGQPVTVSFWARAASASAVGQHIGFQNYNYGGPSGYGYYGMTATWGAVGQWVRNSYTFTPTHNYLISYWFPSSGNMKVDIANIQVEQKSHVTPFTLSSRSNTTALLDLTGRTTIDLNTASFDSAGHPILDGTDDRIDLGNVSDYFPSGVRAVTVESVFKITPGASGPEGPLFENYRFNIWYNYSTEQVNCYTRSGPPDTAGYQFSVGHTGSVSCNAKGSYNHVVVIYETLGSSTGRIKMYINGVFAGSSTGVKMGAYPIYGTWIGQSNHGGYGTYKLNGQVNITKVYTGALTDAEITANYQNLKTRFGI